MKTFLTLLLLIPSMCWGKETFLNCEALHGLKNKHLDITILIKDFPLNAKIILFSRDVRNELKLSQSEIEYYFSEIKCVVVQSLRVFLSLLILVLQIY